MSVECRSNPASALILVSGLLCIALAAMPVRAQDVGAEYTIEYRRNVDGGLRRGGAWLDQLVLWAGDQSHWYASVLVTNNKQFSPYFSGDVQTVSNIDAGDTLRLFEAWYQWRLGTHDLLAGLFDLNSEFDSIDSADIFNNASHGIGPELAQSGQRGPSIFPHASLALRLAGGDQERAWRMALLDAVPGSATDQRRTAVQLRADEGALLIGEADWRNNWRFAVGGWAYSTRIDNHDEDGRARQYGAYFLTEGLIAETDAGSLNGFARVGTAAGSTLVLSEYLGAGFLLALSERQQIGLGIALAQLSTRSREQLELVGFNPARNELAIELTWRSQLTNWLAIQPDLQYVRNPGGNRDVDGAVVAALRFELTLGPE